MSSFADDFNITPNFVKLPRGMSPEDMPVRNFNDMTVGDAIKLNKRERRKMRKINWDKTIICGVSLGFMASVIYMLFVIALEISK